MKIKPATADLLVRDPLSGEPLPADGITVAANRPYWLRRLRDGDVVEIASKTRSKEPQT